jgi:hypothetical protein
MPLQIVERGFRTLVFSDKPNGVSPEPDAIPLFDSFSASRIASLQNAPVRVFDTKEKIEVLPVRPISDTPPPT